MKTRRKDALRNIENNLSIEERMSNLMLDKLHRSVMHGKEVQAGIISQSIKIMFPKTDVAVADTTFEALWKLGKHKQAIKVYLKAGRPFWHSEAVGHYYERQGRIKKAMVEYEYLVNEYLKIRKDFLPLPKGPAELFKLGRWYASRNRGKAMRYLKLYLSAETVCGSDPVFYLRHKHAAKRILSELEAVRT